MSACALLLALLVGELPPGTSAATRALVDAVEADDLEALTRALARKPDVNVVNLREGATPLMMAANAGNVAAVKRLLAAGAKPNLAPHTLYQHGPLFYALMGPRHASRGEKTLEQINAVVEALLAGGADPNLSMAQSEPRVRTTPTLIAATLHPSTLQRLLAKGGDPNVEQGDGKSVFELALDPDHGDEDAGLERLELLLGGGARLPTEPKPRLRLATRALLGGWTRVLARLEAAGWAIDPAADEAPRALALFAAAGDAARYDALAKAVSCERVAKAPDLLLLAIYGLLDATPERQAATLTLAKRLATCGAPAGASCLRVAARAGAKDAVAWLLPLVAKPLEPDREGNTALHLAAKHGHLEIVRLILQRIPSLDDGTTPPLELAAEGGHVELVDALFERSSPAARERALAAAARAACATKDPELQPRLASTLSTLVARGLPLPSGALPGCAPGTWAALAEVLRQREAQAGGTRQAVALVWGGDATSAESWAKGLEALAPSLRPWVRPLGGYPRRVRSDDVQGLKPGFDLVLAGVCGPEEADRRLEALKAFYAGVYARPVTVPAAMLGCPVLFEQPLVSATKSSPVANGTLTVSVVRQGARRSCVATQVGADGALVGFAEADLTQVSSACGAAEASYEEELTATRTGGTCRASCGSTSKRFTLELGRGLRWR